ncbi:type II and III secretion system protein family protein [uncultured Sphingorhabdus sp.]|uniref:type II and III secretion system protein family protein n=1 Tax=uncultured Sphingorhabdus sp. TaxID=1686106 RepID=UPI00261351BA|nr:type II and III secretion system protein family protein [uncultured Sphingorhabdus sp.]HMS20125.1 type II and III secretion system protein family protein [Sphingorhabdus sp.]
MTIKSLMKSGAAAIIFAASISTVASAAPAKADPAASKTGGRVIVLSVGRGEQINLGSSVSDVVVSNPTIADVDVRSPRQLYILGKGQGETTVYATDAAGRTIYSATIRVGNNLDSVDQMLLLAMPEADIKVSTMNGVVLLTGTVAQPEDVQEAETLVQAFVGDATKVVSRLKTAVPMQVNLQVRIAEVSRSLAKEIASNFTTRDNDGNGLVFGVGRGRNVGTIGDLNTSAFPRLDASSLYGLPAGSISLPFNPATGQFITGGTQYTFNNPVGSNVLNLAGKLFGIDVAAAFDIAERAGLSTTLAQPNLTTISGESAEFLAGGQFPIPVADNFGATTVQFRDFGVSLRYTPTVQSDGRILLRVRPEVSDISSQGAVRIAGTEIPAITTRMAETTVELGSGQSFMIAGLLSNSANTSVDKYPGLGDVPVLGALFKSNGWKRNETELVIVVTPYLVKPVSESEIKLPTDGYNTPTDLERILLNKTASNLTGSAERPMPTVAPDNVKGPEFGTVSEAAPAISTKQAKKSKSGEAGSAPGFSFN